MKLFTIEERRAISYASRTFQNACKLTFFTWDYVNNALCILYKMDGVSYNIILSIDEVMQVIQFDVSVKTFDAFSITDESNTTYPTYGDYFETCPQHLWIEFIACAVAIRALTPAMVIQINQTLKAA